jgi:hypothetical protein
MGVVATLIYAGEARFADTILSEELAADVRVIRPIDRPSQTHARAV